MRNPFLLFVFTIAALHLQAQYQLTGKVTNTKLEPLAFVSVQVKGAGTGTITKQDGSYRLPLEEGRYDIVFSMIGYVPQSITLVVTKNEVQNIILETESAVNMDEVVVKGKVKDRAEEIMRQVIRSKEHWMAAAGAYSCNVYIKAVQEDSLVRNKNKKPADTARLHNANIDLQRMAMAEVYLQLDYDINERLKEERLGVKKRGNAASLFYLSATEGNFNFYNNLVKVPAIATLPFLSPVSYSGLLAYKFKTVRIQQMGAHKIYTLSVKPRKISNATVEGEITITDSAWAVLHTRFRFPSYHLPEYDFFEVEQHYTAVANKAMLIRRQQFIYFTKSGKGKLSGQTVVHYSDYELNKGFDKKHFGVEVSATAAEAYKRDSTFWQTTRTEPLTEKEVRFIRYSDSLYHAMHTKHYLDSIDKRTNKITWKKVAFMGQTFFNREKERTWSLPPVLSLVQPLSFGGVRIQPSFFFSKVSPSRKNIYLSANLSYGVKNNDLNGSIRLNRMYNPYNRGFYRFSAGRDFQFIFSGDAWINMIKRSNYYLNNFISAGHGLELANGLFFYADADVAFRRSVRNYKTNNLVDSLLGDVLENNQAIAFDAYNAVYGKLRLQYTPKQRYIRQPLEKVILGSAWPTFYISWRKGVPGILNSKVDFDYLEMGMEQEVHAGLLGVARYNIKTGSFLNKRDLRLVDYQFQRRGDPLLFLNPDEAFQALDSTFPVFKRFYQGHFVHEFNGFFLNKIPLLKKLGLREVGGAGFLLAPERNLRYAEAFVGVERVFKWPFNPLSKFKLGVYVVGSAANQFSNGVQFKVGVTSWDKQRNKWF